MQCFCLLGQLGLIDLQIAAALTKPPLLIFLVSVLTAVPTGMLFRIKGPGDESEVALVGVTGADV